MMFVVTAVAMLLLMILLLLLLLLFMILKLLLLLLFIVRVHDVRRCQGECRKLPLLTYSAVKKLQEVSSTGERDCTVLSFMRRRDRGSSLS
jgi:hypothetical protein